jgi:hypothetical protein
MKGKQLLIALLLVALLATVLMPVLVAAAEDSNGKQPPAPGPKPLLPTPKPLIKVTPRPTKAPLGP